MLSLFLAVFPPLSLLLPDIFTIPDCITLYIIPSLRAADLLSLRRAIHQLRARRDRLTLALATAALGHSSCRVPRLPWYTPSFSTTIIDSLTSLPTPSHLNYRHTLPLPCFVSIQALTVTVRALATRWLDALRPYPPARKYT